MNKKIISLGMNCEISFQIERYVNEWYSSLFSWAFVVNDDDFLKAIKNIDDVFTNEVHFHLPTVDMFMDEKYNIAFHGRTPKGEFLSEDGSIIDMVKYNEALDELKHRLNHLKNKFKSDLHSSDEKIYIKKYLIEPDIETWGGKERLILLINQLYSYLEKETGGENYKLVVVLSKRDDVLEVTEIERERLFIRFVDHWAPYYDTRNGADNESWKKIFEEFI